MKKNKVKEEPPGITFEKVVAQIQQKMDPKSVVTHNEVLHDRVGNDRQCDVVIRGSFAGRPILGIMECKDLNKKIGPDVVEAFAKKTENLGANVRILVSKKGFTRSALNIAKHENIGCLSLLPDDPMQAGFSIGDMWYGVIQIWDSVRLVIKFSTSPDLIKTYNADTVKINHQLIGLWFMKKLITIYGEEQVEGKYLLGVTFHQEQKLEIEGKIYSVLGVACAADRVCRKKKKWMVWSGDAFYDWQSEKFTIAPNGTIVGSAIRTDLSDWLDHNGEIPKIGKDAGIGFMKGVIIYSQKWDPKQDLEVPDLETMGTTNFQKLGDT